MVATGEKITVPADPPSFLLSPWNTVTAELLVAAATTGTTIELSSIISALALQLGISGAANIGALTARLRTVRAWMSFPTSGIPSPGQTLSLDTYAFPSIAASPIVLMTQSDGAGAREWASVGFRWPLSSQSVPFDISAASAAFKIYSSITAGSEPVVIRCELLWRFIAPKDIPRRSLVYPASEESVTVEHL